MSDTAVRDPSASIVMQRSSHWAWLGLCIVLALWIIDFHFDVRDRDFISWLDPAIYYEQALAISAGSWRVDVHLPTLFPYAIAPLLTIHPSIPTSLWVNVVFIATLGMSVHLMRGPLMIRTPSFVIVVMVLASPVMIGLSRTLHAEVALTGVVTLAYALWFRSDDFTNRRMVAWFAFVFAVALMMKPTAAVFFLGPWCYQTVLLIVRRQFKQLVWLTLAGVAALMLMSVIQLTLFRSALVYYRHPSLPVAWAMSLIGPIKSSSWSSISYYFVQLITSYLLLFSPLFLISIVCGLLMGTGRRDRASSIHDVILWLWLLVPMFVLIYPSMKEPRHAAPCTVPAVLLICRGLSKLGSDRLQKIVTMILLVVSLTQYFLITNHALDAPYFNDDPLDHDQMVEAMVDQEEQESRFEQVLQLDLAPHEVRQCWMYTTNFAIAGFRRSEALAMAWQLMPGIVYDLDRFVEEGPDVLNIAYERYDNLFSYTHFNLYNARCGWPMRYFTLNRKQVVDNAEFIILKRVTEDNAAARFPNHTLHATIDGEGGRVLILSSGGRSVSSFRQLYGNTFLQRMPLQAFDQFEAYRIDFDALCYDQFKTAFLSGRETTPDEILRNFPKDYLPDIPLERPMYWLRSAEDRENRVTIAFKEWADDIRHVRRRSR